MSSSSVSSSSVLRAAFTRAACARAGLLEPDATELERLLTLHKLHFFPSDPGDLVPITPDILQQLQPILLSEPANQPKKWLSAPETGVSRKFLEALRDFMYWENYDVRVRMDGKIDKVVLADILSKRK